MSGISGTEAVTNHEENEFIEMESLLSSLLEEEIISSIEYRLIVSSKGLSDRQSAIYKILDSKHKLEAVKLEKFRKLNARVNTQVLRRKKNLSANGKNPLLIYMTISSLFGLLSFEEIKLCRLVCQSWNSIAEVLLRKKAAINFKPVSLEPANFLETFKLSLPQLPFTNFIFSSSGKRNPWCTSALEEFFNKWGDNIKSLTFNQIYLKSYKKYDVTPWFEKARNLAKLKIDCCSCDETNCSNSSPHSSDRTALELQLDKMTSLKSLSAKKCVITVDPTKSSPRFTPLEIQLDAVSWKLRGGRDLQTILLNEFIDFGHAFTILKNAVIGTCQFDMACQVFDTKLKFRADCIDLLNWGRARGNMDLIFLRDFSLEAPNELHFKQLFLKYSKVNLNFLPQGIEKLYYSSFNDDNEIVCDRTIQLPNLSFLGYKACGRHSGTLMGNFLPLFSNCSNLSELELFGENIYNRVTLDVDLVPRSVRKMKVRHVNFVGDSHYELDTLIIEDNHLSPLFNRTAKVMLKIQPRVLVVKCLRLNAGLKTSVILAFVKKNTQLETLKVGTEKGVDLHANDPFEGSILSRWVDGKSNYYKFENKRGQSLSSREFEALSNLNGLDNPERF